MFADIICKLRIRLANNLHYYQCLFLEIKKNKMMLCLKCVLRNNAVIIVI